MATFLDLDLSEDVCLFLLQLKLASFPLMPTPQLSFSESFKIQIRLLQNL